MGTIRARLTPMESKRIVFFDMDGVIADWVSGVADLFQSDPEPAHAVTHKAYNDAGLADVVGAGSEDELWASLVRAGSGFWYSLPALKDGIRCVNTLLSIEKVSNVAVRFLTKPTHSPSSYSGKALWIAKHFGPKATERLTICHEKYLLSRGNTLLLDDDPNNVDAFNQGGGVAILVARPFGEAAARQRENTFNQAIAWAQFKVDHLSLNFAKNWGDADE